MRRECYPAFWLRRIYKRRMRARVGFEHPFGYIYRRWSRCIENLDLQRQSHYWDWHHYPVLRPMVYNQEAAESPLKKIKAD